MTFGVLGSCGTSFSFLGRPGFRFGLGSSVSVIVCATVSASGSGSGLCPHTEGAIFVVSVVSGPSGTSCTATSSMI